MYGSYAAGYLPFDGLDQQISEIEPVPEIRIQYTASAFAVLPIIALGPIAGIGYMLR